MTPPRETRFRSRIAVVCWLFVLPFAASAPLPAQDVFVAELVPGAEVGSWSVRLEGRRAERKAEDLRFEVDGVVVPAERVAGEALRFQLTDVPATADRLVVAEAGRRGSEPLAALRLSSVDEQARPYAGWSVYHVMLGHFRNGNSANDGQISGWSHPQYIGGDLQGVLEKVDYLADLGVTAVWLSPIFQARTSHGYDVLDYYRVGDRVAVPGDRDASLALLRQLRDALHARGIRVVLDIPLNHAHRGYDREAGDPKGFGPRATGPRQDAEKLWESWGGEYRYWDFSHQPTRDFLTEAALHWLRDEKIDGLRLDYVRGVPHDYWAEFHSAVKAAVPNAWLVGECWDDRGGPEGNLREIARYYAPDPGRQFDSLLDFPLQQVLVDVFARGGDARDLEAWLQATAAQYPPDALPALFLDNHDMARFSAWIGQGDHPDDRLTAAVSYLATLTGPIILFYGTEQGLTHAAPQSGFTDVSRVPMNWQGAEAQLFERIAQPLRARKSYSSLRLGSRRPLVVGEDVLVSVKEVDGEQALVGVNLGSQTVTVELHMGAADWKAVLGESVPVASEGAQSEQETVTWRLAPLSTSVVVRELHRL